jgi:hypothetical protein
MGFADNYERQPNNAVRGNTTPRPRRTKNPKAAVGSPTAQVAAAQNTIVTLTKDISDLDIQIKAQKLTLQNAIDNNFPSNEITIFRDNLNFLQSTRSRKVTDRNNAIQTRNAFQSVITEKANASETKAWEARAALFLEKGAGGGGGGGEQLPASITAADNMARVNLSAARELYFKGNEQFIKDTVDVEGFVPASGVGGGSFNSPTFSSAFASFETAQTLWKSGKATKGRIQSWLPPSNTLPDYLPNSSDKTFKERSIDIDRRIFQFHYNPGSISMGYNGVPDIDVTMYTAGIERFNLWNQSKSTIAFELLLNRMPDMKYIDPNRVGYQKQGVDYKTKVYDRTPINTELQEIYDKGTMYDVEFLLRVLLGYRLKSQLRGGKLTSDVGWITPRPVELHLGSSLRYLVNVVDLTLNHVIFNERMVPLFTTVRITGTRIPDFDGNVQRA